MDNLQNLLKEINIVREKWQQKKEAEERFNVFTTLVKRDSEEELHSRFISSLLDPKGPHKMGTFPLKLFLDAIGSNLSFDKGVEVIPNNRTWSEHKKIDILIRDPQTRSAIIIENKINAGDSNHSDRGQLEGYYQTILSERYCKERIEVYYLTLDRHEPSEESIGTNNKTPEIKDKVCCIDYPREIKRWLENLVKETYAQPYLREAINQYIKLINNMTGDINIEERKELATLVGKNEENLQSTKMLITNYKHICWHTIDDFKNEMSEALCNKNINVTKRFINIDDIVHGGLKKRKSAEFRYCIKEKDLTWTLQTSCDDFNGFFLGVKKSTNNKIDDKLKQVLEEYAKDKIKGNDWYFWVYLKDRTPSQSCLYFWDFTKPNTNTFDIISSDKRKIIIEEMVTAIKEQIADFANSMVRGVI
ncbi:MAG: PD-(D/E)XK nuclease family protein [Bacteroidales bacterium]|nr:PD-(D/E)XK nuclease family protein [Bacteroidales bacterium]